MEAFAALGFAANIAQFLELGASIFKDAKEIKDAGSTVSTSHLATIASDLEGLSSSLKAHYLCLDPQSQPEEKALYDLALRCSEAADELSGLLGSIIHSSAKKTVWDTTVAAIRTRWHHDRVNALAERLAEYRGQLTLRLLLVLNRQQRAGLESVRDDIVEIISVNVRDMMAKIGQGHDKTIAAIFKTRSGLSTAVGRTASPLPADNLLRTSVTYSQGTGTGGSEAPKGAQFRTALGIPDYGQKIMDALHFRGITERRSAILPVHKETFLWIWDDSFHPDFKGAKWDALGPWLRERRPAKGNCYWVSGKAGSGKSSLLKYAQGDPRLARDLQQWAGDAQLVTSSFYFWYAGTDLQKSHVGLLRGLLHDVLKSRPEMAAVLFPDVCRAIISGELSGRIDLSLWELRAAFSKLIQTVPDDLRICFIIDGIDEYTGDYNELCQLLLEAAACPSIKALVSSRPIPACCDRFRRCPSLRLQDLTQKDIHQYVAENLGNHHLMSRMESVEPGVTSKVVSEVAGRASGVFLWVVVVVKNLILRLQNYDGFAILMEEVKKLPVDLEKLYDHMLGSMSEQNQVSGSKFLQLVLRHAEICKFYPLTLLQLSFAEQDDYDSCLKDDTEPLTTEACEWRCEAAEGRIRAYCCGLCEVHTSSIRAQPTVGFIHRTVFEFLQLGPIWDKLTTLTSNSTFNTDLALVSSSVFEMKAMVRKPWDNYPDENVLDRMFRMLVYEKHLNSHVRVLFHDRYLEEMRKAVAYHWHNPRFFSTPGQELGAVESSYNRARRRLKLEYPHSCILSLGIQGADSRLYNAIYLDLDENVHPNSNPRALGLAYLMIHMLDEPQGNIRLLMANAISKCASGDPEKISIPDGPAKKLWNERWKHAMHSSWTLWEFLLHYCYSILNNTEDSGVDFSVPAVSRSLLIVISGLLSRGASANSVISVTTKRRGWTKENRELLAWSVIMPILSRVWAKVGRYSATEKDEVADLSCNIETALDSQRELGIRSHSPAPVIHASKAAAEGRKSLRGASSPPKSPPNPSQRLESTSSPWFRHKPQNCTRKGTATNANSPETRPTGTPQDASMSDAQWQKRWSATNRNRRVELLTPDQQKLVQDLARPDPSAKENRRAFGQLSALPFHKQREVLDCVAVMKSTKPDP